MEHQDSSCLMAPCSWGLSGTEDSHTPPYKDAKGVALISAAMKLHPTDPGAPGDTRGTTHTFFYSLSPAKWSSKSQGVVQAVQNQAGTSGTLEYSLGALSHSTVRTQHPFLIYCDAVLCLMGFTGSVVLTEQPWLGRAVPTPLPSHKHPTAPCPLSRPSWEGRDSPSLEQLGWDSGKCPGAGESPGWGGDGKHLGWR